MLIALGGLLSYNTFNPFVEDASDRLAMGTQLATFFVFLAALMVQVDAVYHRSGFAVLLVVVTFVPPLISVCSAFHAFHSAMKQMEPDSPKAPGSEGSDSAKTPRSSEATVKGPDRVEDDEEQQKPAPLAKTLSSVRVGEEPDGALRFKGRVLSPPPKRASAQNGQLSPALIARLRERKRALEGEAA